MLKILEREAFDQVYLLMEKSFPKDEFRPYEGQKALLDNPSYRILAEKDGLNGALKGFLAVWDLGGFVFLEHFAVDPAYRNGGIGSRMLCELAEWAKRMVCLEVEPPENEIAARRVGFYKRNNFFFNEYPYIQPALATGQSPVPLFLMTSGRPLDKREFEEMKTALYTKVYGQGQKD